MNTELGNTTLESLGILTGIEGYRAALADPPNWQARLDGESQWLDYEDKLDNCWSVWDARMIVHDSVVQWRRKPDMKRDPMRYVVRPIELRDDMIVGEPNGHFVDVNLRLPFAWNRRVASIAVEEIVDKTERIPLQPAEAKPAWSVSPEATAAEIERLTKRVNELVNCHDQDKRLLASALGSQKAAVAALEVERKRGEQLRHKTECLVRRITGTGTRDIIRDVVALLNEAEFSESTKAYLQSDETAGKESG
jgi:hypothetical protein